MDISNLPDKEFKVMVLKLFNELGIRMDEYSEKILIILKKVRFERT